MHTSRNEEMIEAITNAEKNEEIKSVKQSKELKNVFKEKEVKLNEIKKSHEQRKCKIE